MVVNFVQVLRRAIFAGRQTSTWRKEFAHAQQSKLMTI